MRRHRTSGRIALAAAAVIVAVASAVSVAAASPAAYIGSDGRIAFVRDGNIFSIKPNGTGLAKLTHLGHASGPRWSPNGTMLAYLYRGNLWIMNANGSHKTQITDAAPQYTDGRPTWSPNGRYLAFVKTARHLSYGHLTRYDTVTRQFNSFTDKVIANKLIKVAALAGSAVAWQWARAADGHTYGSFIIFEGAGQQCLGERFCLDALGFTAQSKYRDGFGSGEDLHSTPTRLTDPDWYPIMPSFSTSVLTTVENCATLPCAHSGLMLRIGAATILPGAYEGVYAPVGEYIAYVENVHGVPGIYTLNISPVAKFNPVYLTNGTEPDWQPTAPFPPD
jgi:hypothetical protein